MTTAAAACHVEVVFKGIENIHHMRRSLQKLVGEVHTGRLGNGAQVRKMAGEI